MRRTDLALEAREIIEGKEEISGVILEEENKYGNLVKVTKMKIESNHGSQIMGKPKGVYITIESKEERKEPLLNLEDYTFFRKVLKSAFSQRRKTLKNCLLGGGFNKEKICQAIVKLGLDENIRGEKLSIEQFGELSKLL